MPFDPDNPPAKLKNLSDKKKRQWVHVFNSCYEKHKNDETCHKMAWGTVKKSAGEMQDIVDQIPEAVARIEEALGVRWNEAEEKFDVLTYPGVSRSEVDSVDNAPGGITAALDLDVAPMKEVMQIGRMLASSKFSPHDCAYASYCLHVMDSVKYTSLAPGLYKNVLATYRENLLSWFKYALIERANLINIRGLKKVLTEFVRAIPDAVLLDKAPDISKFKGDWQFLNSDRLERAGLKVVKTVREDSIDAGLWEEDEFSSDEPPLYFDNRYKVWNVPYSDWTLRNKRFLSQMGFRVDRANRWWYVLELTPKIKQYFDVGGKQQNVEVQIPPTKSEMREWYFKTWLPQNIGRFQNLFENYVRSEGSTLKFNFKTNKNGKVDVTMKRGVTSVAKAIEELRVRYMGRQGREMWLEVMDKFIDLYATKGPRAMPIIDRMNNLEHSNGMFLEKFPTAVQGWYRKFLNAKYSAPTPAKLARYISDKDLSEFIIFMDQTYGSSPRPKIEDEKEYQDDPGKEVPEGPDWLKLHYPYAKGKKKPDRRDIQVQKGLDVIRDASVENPSNAMPISDSERIIREIRYAKKEIEAAIRWKING